MEETGKNRVNVTIDGREYTIVGKEPEEYILSIAKRVDDKINETGASAVNFSMRLILAALNLADETEKKSAQIQELENLIKITDEKNEILQNTVNTLRSELKMKSNIVKLSGGSFGTEDDHA